MKTFDELLTWWSNEGYTKVSYGIRVTPDGSIMKTPKTKGMGFKLQPIKNNVIKVGRNDKVLVTKGTDSKVIKYKKFKQMEKDGWALAEV